MIIVLHKEAVLAASFGTLKVNKVVQYDQLNWVAQWTGSNKLILN